MRNRARSPARLPHVVWLHRLIANNACPGRRPNGGLGNFNGLRVHP